MRAPRALVLLAVLLTAAACAPVAPVVQGKVVDVDAGAKVIAVQDELKPGDPPLLVDIGKAEIGAPPVTGDEVRLVYRTVGGRNVALRVMNITRQMERGKAT